MLHTKIELYNWDMCKDEDICVYATNVRNRILEIAKNNIPNKMVRIYHYDSPWITSEIKLNIRKRKSYRQIKTTHFLHYWQRFADYN